MNPVILVIGLVAQLFFSARILTQWLISEKKHKVISPSIFWVFSLSGSFLLFIYGWMRNDFAIITGQFISYYIYIGNLRLKGVWSKVPAILRYFLYFIPAVAVVATLSDIKSFTDTFFRNEDIPAWLIIYGVTGQIIFTLRCIYQWIYSSKIKESGLPAGFWWISITGSLTICSYAILRYDPILILGQSFGMISYARNLMIGYKNKKAEVEQ